MIKRKNALCLSRYLIQLVKNVSVSERFHCEYGKNINIGNDVIVGPNCTFIDNDKITIGNCIMIAPNVQMLQLVILASRLNFLMK